MIAATLANFVGSVAVEASEFGKVAWIFSGGWRGWR